MSTGETRVALDDSAPGDLVALENTLKAATSQPAANNPDKSNTNEGGGSKPEKPDWIQDKFWTGDLNESAQKQAQAYGPLQSAYGRMANDLGTQRKLTDQMLQIKRNTDLALESTTTAKKPPVVDPRALVDNPTETLDRYWQDRETALRKEWEAEQARTQQNAAEAAFMARHADFAEVTATEKFNNWVHSSPLRKRAAALAAQGNYVVADELLTEYKAVEGHGPKPSADPNRGATAAEQAAARAASTESAAQAPGGASKGGPVYRRADLIALKMNKPEVYSDPKFQEEILRAYAEGRVK